MSFRISAFPVRAAAILLVLIAASPAAAQWSHNPVGNNPICTAPNNQGAPAVVGDGRGGAIIAWHDNRPLAHNDIYVQRIDDRGIIRWTVNGVGVVLASGNQTAPVITTDGAGGAIIAWEDLRGASLDIYAQRVDSSGTVSWTANGVAVCTSANYQGQPALVSDGLGGSYISWSDYRSGTNYDVYAQRLSAGGAILWTANGVAICASAGDQAVSRIERDGTGAAVIAWSDTRNAGDEDIYAQRVAPTGLVQWAVNGIPVCTVTGVQYSIRTARDESGGTFISWGDNRSATVDVYAQRLDSLGTALWLANGRPVSLAPEAQIASEIAGDGEGGAYLVWQDHRFDASGDIYAQKIGPDGAAEWAIDGIPVSTMSHGQTMPRIVNDGAGGVIVAWTDFRNNSDYNIYAQALDRFGTAGWEWGGTLVSSAPVDQFPLTLAADGEGGAILAWTDSRPEYTTDIYAQRVDPRGFLGVNVPGMQSVTDVPADQGGKVTVAWDASPLDAPYGAVITMYSVWQGIDIPAPTISSVPGGSAYRVRRTSTGATYWEKVGEVPAHYLASYKFTAPTLSDSAAGGVPWHRYFVSAETQNPFLFWDSEIDSGYSVDNLAPSGASPVAAVVQGGPSVAVSWGGNTSDPDVKHYEVHRSLSGGFMPDGSTLIGQTADTVLVDGSPVAGAVNYYRIVTVDLHDNRSAPSVEAAAVVGTTQLYAVQDKWNMVSVPMLLADYAKTAVYPTAVSNAFYFNNAYTAAGTLANGPGYWVKFDGAQDAPITGVPLESAQYPVTGGWNMVGSIGSPVDVANVTSTPPGMVTSNFFAFTNMYTAVTAIEPGKGYWVKMSGPGTLNLSAAGPVDPSARIRIVDDGERPPLPPGDDIAAGVPAGFVLEQNYPNPFNPATEIRFGLPAGGEVRLSVYNALGQEVARLLDGIEPAGYGAVSFDASALPSGIYTCRITAGAFTAVRKMLLLK